MPHHLEWDEAGIVPRSLFTAAGEHGFLGMAIPTEFGGGGVDDREADGVVHRSVVGFVPRRLLDQLADMTWPGHRPDDGGGE